MKYRTSILALLAFFVLIVLWYILSVVIDRAFLPNPLETFVSTIHLIQSKELPKAFAISSLRIIVSTVLALGFAIPIGILMGRKQKLNTFFSPFIAILYPLPKVVFLPILVVFFGLGNLPKIILIALIIFFQILQ